MQKSFGHRRQRGISLVEIMVALFIGLFLTAGILQIFMGTRQTYRFEEGLSRIQENGRYALEAIARDARMAGFAGCTRLVNLPTPNSVAAGVNLSNANLIVGENQVGGSHALGALPGTDLVRIQGLAGNGARVDQAMASEAGAIRIATNPDGFKEGDTLAIADCNNIDIFDAASVTGMTITPNAALSKVYLVDSQVFSFRNVTYFVGTGGSGRPALRRAGSQAGDLVEGVQDMQILYGEDTTGSGSPNLYRRADQVANWERVVGLRVSLLLVSDEDNLTGVPQSVAWRGATLTPTDTRIRQVFTTTIALRNRLP